MDWIKRTLPGAEFRLDEGGENDAGPVLTGYAAVFSTLSEDLGGFREQIRPGAFTKTLRERPDIRALWQHDAGMVLGRTRNKTLSLWEDEVGLGFRLYPPDSQWGRDAVESIRRGDVSEMSFGFRVVKDALVQTEPDVIRELVEVALHEISPVTFAAYTATEVDLRALLGAEYDTENALSTTEAALLLRAARMGIKVGSRGAALHSHSGAAK